ncbi:MAG: HD domain-containing protein [Pseudomonadota bacterium]
MNILEQVPLSVHQTWQRVQAAGHGIHLVGGAVRDILLGRATSDFDLASSATPQQLTELFERVIPTGWKHGTVTVVQPDGLLVEITSYRSEGPYSDGRHPDLVQLGSTIEQDLGRRDFTINAMAVNCNSGQLLDLHGGQDDLRARLVRTVGEPAKRFQEDGLRLWRAARFAATLEFEVEPGTLQAMREQSACLRKVAAERQKDELLRLLQAVAPSRGFRLLQRTGLLNLVLPELERCVGVEQGGWHQHDVFEHSLAALDAAPQDHPTLRLALLLHDIGKPGCARGELPDRSFHGHEQQGAELARQVLERLRFSRSTVDEVVALVAGHMWHYTDDWSDGAVRRFVSRLGLDRLNDVFLFRDADLQGRGETGLKDGQQRSRALTARIEQVLQTSHVLTVRDLALDGKAVCRILGIEPGPIVGQALAWCLEQVQDRPQDNNSETLEKMLRDWYRGRGH